MHTPSLLERSANDLATVEDTMQQLARTVGKLGKIPNTQEHTQVPKENLDAIIIHQLKTGGKRLRARLALAAGEVLALPRHGAILWAAACELLHNATLIHDDLQDGDTHRRGQPTIWQAFGVGQAINAGDLMFVLPQMAILQIPTAPPTQLRLIHALLQTCAQIIRGQNLESLCHSQGCIDRASYEHTVGSKTAALFALPVHGAHILGTPAQADPNPEQSLQHQEQSKTLNQAFAHLGILFQIQDDLVDLWGAKGRDMPGNDLREGKIAAPVIAHLEHCPNDKARFLALLNTPRQDTRTEDVAEAIRAMEISGAQKTCLSWINEHAEQGRKLVEAAALPTRPHAGSMGMLYTQALDTLLAPIAHLLHRRP